MQPEFHNKPGSSAHAWITDSAPESIERQHDRSRNRFSGTPLKKCARIGRPGGRQAAGGQAGGQKPCAPVMADGPTQSEAVRSSIPPYSAIGTKSCRDRCARGRNRRAVLFAGVKTVRHEGHSFPYSGPPLHSAGPCIRISAPESAEFRSAWLLNRSADRFTELC